MRLTTFLLFGCLFLSVSSKAQENKASFTTELADILHNMKAYTLEVADRMPESDYNFQPVDSVMSFREQLSHMNWILHFHTYFLLEEQPLTPASYQQQLEDYQTSMKGFSKAELLAFTGRQFDYTIERIRNLPAGQLDETFTFSFLPNQPTKTFRVICQTIHDHVTHHRAQMIVYLRLKGINPPAYQLF